MSHFDLVIRGWLMLAIPFILIGIFVWIFIKRRRNWKPRFVAWLMNRLLRRLHRSVENEKEEVFHQLIGDSVRASPFTILEIGAGSGMNFKFYPENSRVICLDPNPYHEYYIRQNKEMMNPKIRHVGFLRGYGENMPEIATGSVDAVTCTFVLCTVRDPQAVFKEIKRVLKPGGKFHYLEHVASDKWTVGRLLQEVFNPVWKKLSDNCHLQRETFHLIKAAGFSSVKQRRFTVRLLPCVRLPGLLGTATT